MIEPYFLIKWLHVLSSTILFGFGAGTAYYFWRAHRTRDAQIIASVGRMVVQADWIFTGISGIVQPLTGIALAHLAGIELSEPWLVASFCLYLVALACWLPVVGLQIKAQRLAAAASVQGTPLGADYQRIMRLWFVLGWPAFISLLCVFWLMITRPTLWM
ncbi:DUF2269 family protein [Taklimakanibacter lacteus]|uniref:DUF2269 family protein n=1 Tax=Taklimakanibacter lacteus TaxID=2268456 RepID=UPI000E65ED4B